MSASKRAPEQSMTSLAELRRDTAVIVFGPDHWGDYPQTRHHVAAALAARGWSVTYTTGPHFIWDALGAKWRHARWRTRSSTTEGVILNWPGRWQTRWPRIAAWDVNVQSRFIATLERQSGWRSAARRIAYLFRPEFVPELARLGDCRVVYHADDSFSKMPNWSPAQRALEEQLVARADLIVATSEGVRRNLPGRGAAEARILANGADVQLFGDGPAQPCPADIAVIPRPRIGYVGSLNPKVDFRLVQAIAAQRPDWHWVLVGRVNAQAIAADPASREAWRTLRRAPNVHILDSKPYCELPRYEGHMDVNTLCYRTDLGGWWTDVSPLKLYEYLAVGRPVVGCALEALAPLRHVVTIANDTGEWISAIEGALQGRAARAVEAGRQIARQHSWSHVVDPLDGWLLDLATPAASRTA